MAREQESEMSSGVTDQPLGYMPDEALRVYERAQAAGVTIRITGGVAIAMRCPSAAVAPLARRYADLDIVGFARERKEMSKVLIAAGYRADEAFNALHGSSRLFFWDPINKRQLDVFLDWFEMCHAIDLRPRLALPGPTMPLADLLLMKLQIIETNDKDLLDIITLFIDHDLVDHDDDGGGINLAHLSDLTKSDWGLWRTVTMVAARADHHARGIPEFAHQARAHDQVQQFLLALEQSEKSRTWKLRAKIGDRKQWYQLPEESH